MKEETRKAILDSIDVWKKKHVFANKQPSSERIEISDMRDSIGIGIGSSYCPLCNLFLDDIYGCSMDCPLIIADQKCDSWGKPYHKVNSSSTWGEFTKNANEMIRVLESCLDDKGMSYESAFDELIKLSSLSDYFSDGIKRVLNKIFNRPEEIQECDIARFGDRVKWNCDFYLIARDRIQAWENGAYFYSEKNGNVASRDILEPDVKNLHKSQFHRPSLEKYFGGKIEIIKNKGV